MKTLKLLFQQAMTITTGIVIVMSIEGIIFHVTSGDAFSFKWYHPLSILLAGVLCALPTLIWMAEETTRKTFFLKLILHYLSLAVVVGVIGFLFRWYDGWFSAFCLCVSYTFVYAFVWLVTLWLSKKDEREINDALAQIRDEE